MNGSLALRLGRPDVGDTGAYGQIMGAVGLEEGDGLAGSSLSAGVDVQGRMSAALLGLIVIGLVGFYVWTRAYQA